jgi:hypothetical protein
VSLGSVASVACGDDGRGSDDAGNDLSRRVRTVLSDDPTLVEDLEVEDVTCPSVTEPQAGNLATCIVHLDGVTRRVEVDIEFREDGSFDVVSVNR